MRFTLTYDGPLKSRGGAADKQAIREQLEPQIRELWSHQPLVRFRDSYLKQTTDPQNPGVIVERHDLLYAPLVSATWFMLAEIDLLMLRPERPGRIVTAGGDIDNKLKTLLDALSIPAPGGAPGPPARLTAGHGGDPIHTLLEDDSLIARINVETDRLLNAPHPEHVRLVIRVTTGLSKLVYGNLGLGSF